jgi:hypothetical protein
LAKYFLKVYPALYMAHEHVVESINFISSEVMTEESRFWVLLTGRRCRDWKHLQKE